MQFFKLNVTPMSWNKVNTCQIWSMCLSIVRQKYYDIVQVNKDKLTFDFRQQDINCSLKRPWFILQSERHASRSEKIMMGYEGGFIPIFLGGFDLPISPTTVQCREYGHIAQRIDSFVHACCWVWILDGHCVQHTVVDAIAKSSVLLKAEDNRWGQLCWRKFDTVRGEH